MNSYSFLLSLCRLNPLSKEKFITSKKYQDAATACILRLSPTGEASPASSGEGAGSVEDVLESLQHAVEAGTQRRGLEMLFMKRAMRPGDRWGGHIAWPGGFLNTDEDDVTAAQREVLEEVGIDISNAEEYVHIGALTATPFGPKNKGLHPQVFLKLDSSDPCFKLDKLEADAVAWIDLDHFLQYNETHTHTILAEDILPVKLRWSKQLLVPLARLIGFDKWHFPCVRVSPRVIASHTRSYDISNNEEWVVWGITFNTIRRLLRHANGGREYFPIQSPYRTNNSIFNKLSSFFFQFYTRRSRSAVDTRLHQKVILSSVACIAGLCCLGTAIVVGSLSSFKII